MNLNNKVPTLEFVQKAYGIEMRIETMMENNEPRNYIKFKFYVKRKGILKRWKSIESHLPELGPVKLDTDLRRSVATFSQKEYETLKDKYSSDYDFHLSTDRNKIYCDGSIKGRKYSSSSILPLKVGSTNPWRNRFKRHPRTGHYIINETIEFTISKPFMFSMDFREEFDKVIDLRKLILALNSKVASEDRLNKIKNLPTLPEYESPILERMRTTGDKPSPWESNNWMTVNGNMIAGNASFVGAGKTTGWGNQHINLTANQIPSHSHGQNLYNAGSGTTTSMNMNVQAPPHTNQSNSFLSNSSTDSDDIPF